MILTLGVQSAYSLFYSLVKGRCQSKDPWSYLTEYTNGHRFLLSSSMFVMFTAVKMHICVAIVVFVNSKHRDLSGNRLNMIHTHIYIYIYICFYQYNVSSVIILTTICYYFPE